MCPFLLRSIGARRAGRDPGVSNRSGSDSACGAPLGKALAGPVISPEGSCREGTFSQE